jgi:hypothetical protein
MTARFVQIGDDWLNVDHIQSVHLHCVNESLWHVRIRTEGRPYVLPDRFPSKDEALDGARRFVQRAVMPDLGPLLAALGAAADVSDTQPHDAREGQDELDDMTDDELAATEAYLLSQAQAALEEDDFGRYAHLRTKANRYGARLDARQEDACAE